MLLVDVRVEVQAEVLAEVQALGLVRPRVLE